MSILFAQEIEKLWVSFGKTNQIFPELPFFSTFIRRKRGDLVPLPFDFKRILKNKVCVAKLLQRSETNRRTFPFWESQMRSEKRSQHALKNSSFIYSNSDFYDRMNKRTIGISFNRRQNSFFCQYRRSQSSNDLSISILT